MSGNMLNEEYLPQGKDIDLKEYISIIYRKRWILISVMVIVMTVTILRTMKEVPIYRAVATLMVDIPTGISPTLKAEGIRTAIGGEEYINTQQSIIRSGLVLSRAVKDAKLPFPEGVLAGMIGVYPIRNSRLINITADSTDPVIAAKVANGVADAYIEQNVENMLFMSKAVLKALPNDKGAIEESTIYGQLKQLEDVEKAQNLPSVFYSPTVQTLRAQKMAAEAELSDLSKRYKDKHPKIIEVKNKIKFTNERFAVETRKVINSIRAELTGQFQVNNIRVIDYAGVPGAPISPNRPKNIMSGLILSIFLGVGLIFIVEMLDDTIKNSRDIEDGIRLPYLGECPILKRSALNASGANYFFKLDKEQTAAEAIRRIRTNIIFSAPKESLKTIILTSTIPQEGKSFISSYLAFSFAKNGFKTLLIDSDTRKPSINGIFGIDRAPGLTNILAEGISADSVIRKTPYDNLYILPCGSKTPSPVELLGSDRMERLVKEFSAKFSKIIIDTPPSLELSDALVLSKIADGVIFVTRSGMVSKDVLNKLRNRFSAAGSKITGVVINFFSMKRHSYYKDKYYHKYYSNYYSVKDDDEFEKIIESLKSPS